MIKAAITAVFAAFFTLIVFNNITDYETNYWCVQTTFKMDNIRSQNVLWRAIHSPWLITLAYLLIILTEATIAVLLWASTILTLLKRDGTRFARAGLTLGFTLFMFGFVVIAGEWFYLWQHPVLANLQQKAAIFSLLMLGGLPLFSHSESRLVTKL